MSGQCQVKAKVVICSVGDTGSRSEVCIEHTPISIHQWRISRIGRGI